MPDIATNAGKRLRYGKESAFGTRPAAASGKTLRRVTSNFKLNRASVASKEVRTDRQRAPTRFGSKSVTGTLQEELSCSSFDDLFAAALRTGWAAGATTGSLTTLASNAGTKKITRTGGSFITDGFKLGDYVESSGSIVASGLVTVLTATDMTLDGTVPTVAAGTAATVTVPGKKLVMPATGHTHDSFFIEEYYEENGRYRYVESCRVDGFDLEVTPDSNVNVTFNFVGASMSAESAAYFTAATAAALTPPLSSGSGSVVIAGATSAIVTSLKLKVTQSASPAKVVMNNSAPDVFLGSLDVTGSVSMYFKDDSLLVASLAETPISLWVRMDDGAGEVFVVKLLELKLGNIDTTDTESDGLVVTADILPNKYTGVSTVVEASTIVLQDTTLV